MYDSDDLQDLWDCIELEHQKFVSSSKVTKETNENAFSGASSTNQGPTGMQLGVSPPEDQKPYVENEALTDGAKVGMHITRDAEIFYHDSQPLQTEVKSPGAQEYHEDPGASVLIKLLTSKINGRKNMIHERNTSVNSQATLSDHSEKTSSETKSLAYNGNSQSIETDKNMQYLRQCYSDSVSKLLRSGSSADVDLLPYSSSCFNPDFHQHYGLHSHMGINACARQVQLPSCDATLKRIKHIESHTNNSEPDQKRYSCPICAVSFCRSSHVKDHLQTHTGEKRFKCQFCNNTYTRVSSVKRHVESDHGSSDVFGAISKKF